jgi:two-component system, cell cycle sensor histidine kinase and response regulator CckA
LSLEGPKMHAPTTSREPSPDSSPIRILLLEDNPADASLELQVLKAAGLQVTSDVVRTSPAFTEALSSKSYEVILCDYSLPGWNGLDALRWVRSSGFKMPFIYVSATLGEDVAVECIKEGATDYITKGNLERLPHAVRRALHEETLRLEKDRVEDEMRKSEERYRLLFESNPQAMWVFQLATLRFLAVNEAAIDHYGYSRSEFLSMTIRDIRLPEDIPALEDSIWKHPEYPEKPQIWRHRTKFGRIIYVEVTGRNIEFQGVAASLILAKDVTALRRSEENLRLLFEQTPDCIFVADTYERFLSVNPAGVQLMGYSPDELRQRKVSDVIVPHDKEAFRTEATRLTGGDVLTMEWQFTRKDGSTFDGSMVARQLSDGRMLGILRDITEPKRAENKLLEYARVVEGLEEMILVVDREYRCAIANRAYLNFRAKAAEEVVGHSLEEVVGKDVFVLAIKEKMDECFRGNAVQAEETYNVPHLGERDIAMKFLPIYGQTGIDRIACVLRDVTELKQADEALRVSEERFSKAFRGSPLPVAISTEADWRFLDVNDAFLSMSGYKRNDVIGRTPIDLGLVDPVQHSEMLRYLKEQGRVAKYPLTYTTAQGTIREAQIWVESIELDEQPCLLVLTHDVTEIQQLEAQFRQAQKMEAVGQLAGGVAHDFNNLLMIIASYARLIPLHIDDPRKVERHAMQIDEAVSRAASVTQQLLAFSRKQVLLPTVLDPNALVLGLGKMLPRLLGEDVVMSLAAHSTGRIRADATQLEQVILNLAVNARDAMPSGGRLIIETRDVYLDGAYPGRKGVAIPAGNYVMLAVSDTGIGMDNETQTHIFEPFFTTKGQAGTGLGLATVYGIVKQSEGFIWVYSELSKGTTFKVYLPIVEGVENASPGGIASERDPRGYETILLAEDEVALRTVIGIYLESLGYKVLTAGNGEEALRLLCDHDQSIDLLLTDIIMPGIGGRQLARNAQEMRPDVPVIYISGYTDRALDLSTIGENATFLQKPFSLSSLASKMRELLGKQS